MDSDGKGLEYCGSLIYRRDGDRLSLESAAFDGGRFVAMQTGSGVTYEPVFHVTDHLGSVRAIADADGNVIERNTYYPFGKKWEDGGLTDRDNRYRYNGKEEQAFAGLPYIDYGARMYDPAIGRWFNHDPLEEKYYGTSPYVFCANNPMKYIDPDGMDFKKRIRKNTITIAATYYTNRESYRSAKQAANFWNERSGDKYIDSSGKEYMPIRY